MAGFNTLNNEHLIRSQVWSQQIKQLLLDDLHGLRFVRVLESFPDGMTFNIPSIGEAEVATFSEGQAVKYNKFDTGNFQFSFDQYMYSANAISEKFKRDSFYTQEVLSSFVPKQHRALMEAVETRILSRGPDAQIAGNANVINGADHRMMGSGTVGAVDATIAIKDFARARYALKKGNVPLNHLVAIVDPTVAYTLETQANVTNLLSPMPKWGNMVNEGLASGFNYRFNIMGFDVYESNYLKSGLTDNIGGVTTSNGVANLFFSAAPGDTMPIIGGFRQLPTVYSEFNKDLQQTEYLTIAEWGFKLYRPENMVVVITETTGVIV